MGNSTLPIKHKIETTGDPKAILQYNASRKEREIIDNEINLLLEMGIIRRAKPSPFACGIVLVSKPGTTEMRMCIDYRPLNALTIKDQYDLPRIDLLLAIMVGLVFFSKVDCRKRYHQVMVFEDHIYKTTFKAHSGTYECPGMPFGQTNSGKTFQRVVDFLFIKHLNVNIFAYQDNILIATPTFELHYEVLEHLFS